MAKKVYAQAVETRPEKIPQSSVLPGREADMALNDAGGWTFKQKPADLVRRFLILGSDKGTYYVGSQDLTKRNVDGVKAAIAADPRAVLDMVVDVNVGGKAKNVDSSLLLYSMLLMDKSIGIEAYTHFNKMIRIGTHLFTLAEFLKAQKAFGAKARRAFAGWYTARTPENLGRQVTKYQQREGWSHANILSLSHINPNDCSIETQAVLRWASGQPMTEHTIVRKNKPGVSEVRPDLTAHLPDIIQGYELVKKATTEKEVITLIQMYGLEREHLPTQWLNSKEVWMSLVFNMKLGALIRNLNKMTAIGLFDNLEVVTYVGNKLTDVVELKGERVHPLTILLALKIYASGKGIKGDLKWTPNGAILEALNTAFYLSFEAVTPVNKPLLFSMDVSGSMGSQLFTFEKNKKGEYERVFLPLTNAEAEAAIMLVAARTEPNVRFGIFEREYHEVEVDPKWSLEYAARWITAHNFGGTDCALPFMHARYNKYLVDFITTTDGDTWAGIVHPAAALNIYRRDMVKLDTRSAVVGMATTTMTIADPNDPLSLDVVGFSTDMFTIVNDFLRGDI